MRGFMMLAAALMSCSDREVQVTAPEGAKVIVRTADDTDPAEVSVHVSTQSPRLFVIPMLMPIPYVIKTCGPAERPE